MPEDWEERELLRELRNGSRRAFERLLDRSERRVYNLAYRLLGDATDAEDATQEIFLEVHRSLPRFRGDSRLDTWVHRIAVNVCLQRRRKKSLPTVPLADEALPHLDGSEPFHAAVQQELRSALEGALQCLPDGQREVVLLHGMQGLSYAEVAEALDCPVGTVKSRLSAAFRRLRTLLSSYAGPERATAPSASVEGSRA